MRGQKKKKKALQYIIKLRIFEKFKLTDVSQHVSKGMWGNNTQIYVEITLYVEIKPHEKMVLRCRNQQTPIVV